MVHTGGAVQVTVHSPTSKTITVCVKVTRDEYQALQALGEKSPGKGLRVLIDKHVPKGKQ